MTPNEATIAGGLAGGLLGAIASVITTLYLVKHGPNYESKIAEVNATLDGRIAEVSSALSSRIADLNTSLSELTQAHTDNFAQQASFQRAEVARQNASLWKPEAWIEVVTDAASLTNALTLKSTQAFALVSVYVQSKTGATLASIPVDKGLKTTGYRIAISHQNILKVKQSANVGGLQNGAMGQLTYRIEMPDRSYEFTLPFTTEDVMVNSTIFTKLLG